MALFNIPLLWMIPLGLSFLVFYYIVPYFWSYGQLRSVPGPILARLSNWWLVYACREKARWRYVDDAHKRYGPVVRIQPNHVSVADERVINAIYGRGNGMLKSSVTSAI